MEIDLVTKSAQKAAVRAAAGEERIKTIKSRLSSRNGPLQQTKPSLSHRNMCGCWNFSSDATRIHPRVAPRTVLLDLGVLVVVTHSKRHWTTNGFWFPKTLRYWLVPERLKYGSLPWKRIFSRPSTP
jgi:hypothetical protein